MQGITDEENWPGVDPTFPLVPLGSHLKRFEKILVQNLGHGHPTGQGIHPRKGTVAVAVAVAVAVVKIVVVVVADDDEYEECLHL